MSSVAHGRSLSSRMCFISVVSLNPASILVGVVVWHLKTCLWVNGGLLTARGCINRYYSLLSGMRGAHIKRKKEKSRGCVDVCVTHPPARNDNSLNSILTWRASLLLLKRWHMLFPTSLCFLKPVWLPPVRVQGERERREDDIKATE